MIDAGYVTFSGEDSDEELSITLLRIGFLILGILFLMLPINILVTKWFGAIQWESKYSGDLNSSCISRLHWSSYVLVGFGFCLRPLL